MSKPITPREITKAKKEALPDAVFDAFNELIAKNWDGHSATMLQKDVAALIASKLDISRQEVFDNHYLDVESLYRKAGWTVEYDKPAYCETYEATFKFSKSRKRGGSSGGSGVVFPLPMM